MPHYDDPAVFYDAGFLYDSGSAQPQPKKNKHMASLKLNLSRKNPAQLIALADLVIPKLAPAAPATPPIPNMAAKVAVLATKSATAKTANDAYEAALAALVNLKQVRDAAADDLRAEHTAVANAIDAEAKGDPVLLSASGYPLAGAPQASTLPGQVMNFQMTAGDAEGALDTQHDPEGQAKTYEVQITTGDPVTGPWATKAQATASRVQITGLTSGQRVWGRARAIGSKGAGPWSDPASKIVP